MALNHPHKQFAKDKSPKLGVAEWKCNACGGVVKRDFGWKVWTNTYCETAGRKAQLYRISVPETIDP